FNELEMAREFFFEKLMDVSSERTLELKPLLRRLTDNISRHPYVLCHRDYHGQNIHIHSDKLYLIDYQDLRMGPDTYDLASLLRDRGVARILGEETELELIDYTPTGACTASPRAARFRRANGARFDAATSRRSCSARSRFSA